MVAYILLDKPSMESTRITVIGAGPAGIALGVEASRQRISETIILEKAGHLCDTIATLYRKGKRVDAVYRKLTVKARGPLSFETTDRESFLAWMDEVVVEYGLDIRYRHEVMDIQKTGKRFQISCGNGNSFETDIVVVAIGIFGRPTKPSYPIPREVKDRIFFSLPAASPADQEILVVGGGDSAAEAACFLSRQNRVTLTYRRSEFFRINEPNLCTLNQCCTFENLRTRLGVDIAGITAHGEGLIVKYTDGEALGYDAVFYFLGGSSPRSFLERTGVSYSDNTPVVDASGESNIPALFLAGDLVAEKGSIMAAFNSATVVMEKILGVYVGKPDDE